MEAIALINESDLYTFKALNLSSRFSLVCFDPIVHEAALGLGFDGCIYVEGSVNKAGYLLDLERCKAFSLIDDSLFAELITQIFNVRVELCTGWILYDLNNAMRQLAIGRFLSKQAYSADNIFVLTSDVPAFDNFDSDLIATEFINSGFKGIPIANSFTRQRFPLFPSFVPVLSRLSSTELKVACHLPGIFAKDFPHRESFALSCDHLIIPSPVHDWLNPNKHFCPTVERCHEELEYLIVKLALYKADQLVYIKSEVMSFKFSSSIPDFQHIFFNGLLWIKVLVFILFRSIFKDRFEELLLSDISTGFGHPLQAAADSVGIPTRVFRHSSILAFPYEGKSVFLNSSSLVAPVLVNSMYETSQEVRRHDFSYYSTNGNCRMMAKVLEIRDSESFATGLHIGILLNTLSGHNNALVPGRSISHFLDALFSTYLAYGFSFLIREKPGHRGRSFLLNECGNVKPEYFHVGSLDKFISDSKFCISLGLPSTAVLRMKELRVPVLAVGESMEFYYSHCEARQTLDLVREDYFNYKSALAILKETLRNGSVHLNRYTPIDK